VNDELLERVEQITLPRHRFWSKDGKACKLRDIAFFETKGGKTFVRLAGQSDLGIEIVPNLNELERRLKSLFVRCHRDYLVAVLRIEGVAERYPEKTGESDKSHKQTRDAADECELLIEGTVARVPVTSTYAKKLKKTLGLASLHHLVPEHPDDKKLRSLGIIDFSWRDLYRLKPNDTDAVEEFKALWQIVKFGKERMLRYFRQAGVNQIDKRRLAKNIIWQVWRWIKKGIRKPFTGNIRTFWYEVKNALGGDEILEPDDVDMFYDALRELIEERRLFRYKDFGFMDMKKIFHEVGAKRPEIILVLEKGGQLEMARDFAAEVGSSFICLGGEPSVLTMEYFSDDLKAAIGERELSLFVMTDINPSGVSIKNNFVDGMLAQGMKINRTEILWESKDVSDLALPGGKVKVVRYEVRGSVIVPVKPSTMSQVTKGLKWFEAVGDPRLKTEQEYPGGARVVTIWGIDSDTAKESLIRQRFINGANQVSRD